MQILGKHTMIIAEAGVNHNGSLETAKRLIAVAADAGADFVKFQTFKAEKIVSRKASKAAYQVENTGNAVESQYDMIKKLELDVSAHKILIEYAKGCGVRFLSTAFDLDSIDLLESLNIPFYKIPSGELTNLPYLEKIASIGKPVVISTGMATLADIESALKVFLRNGYARKDIIVLHCNTEYPTPVEDVNLRAMQTIKQAYGVQIGYSDHTLGIEIPIAAVALGAVCIEKHFTLDKTMEGPDHKASLEPRELKAMISCIRNIEKALGDGIKQPSASEKKNIPIARKSIHLASDLPEDHQLTSSDLVMKRPGDGISPMRISEVIGKKLKKAMPIETKLDFSDLI